MSDQGLPIPGKSPQDTSMEDEVDDLSVLLSRSAPKVERRTTVVPIQKDDVEFSEFDRAIVVAIDDSSNCEAVVEWAASCILRRRKDLVVLVNVQPESKSWKSTGVGGTLTRPFARSPGAPPSQLDQQASASAPSNMPVEIMGKIDEEAKERCKRILSPYAEKLQRDGFVVKGICLIGNPKEVLVAVSNVRKPTMIIMGTHGRGSVKRFLMGSVAEYVLHHSAVPVLIVPNGVSKPSESE